MSKPDLHLDHARLETVACDLGLEWPIWVTIERLRDEQRPQAFVGGRYWGTDSCGAHRISINPYQTAKAANKALAHELTHALQCERLGSWVRFERQYVKQLWDAGVYCADEEYYQRYREIQFECEAYAMQDELQLTILSAPANVNMA